MPRAVDSAEMTTHFPSSFPVKEGKKEKKHTDRVRLLKPRYVSVFSRGVVSNELKSVESLVCQPANSAMSRSSGSWSSLPVNHVSVQWTFKVNGGRGLACVRTWLPLRPIKKKHNLHNSPPQA